MIKSASVIGRNSDGTYDLGCDTYECAGCKSRLFCNQKKSVFKAKDEIGFELSIGQKVLIGMSPAKTVISVMIVFAVPLVLMLTSLLLAQVIGLSDPFQAGIAIFGLALGMLLSAFFSRRFSSVLMPKIVAKAS